MFMVGLDLNAGLIKGRAHALVATSHASILLPFLLGSVLALALYPRLSSRDVPFTSFVLFLAVAMSITAFPVLARILTDRGMSRTELGVLALELRGHRRCDRLVLAGVRRGGRESAGRRRHRRGGRDAGLSCGDDADCASAGRPTCHAVPDRAAAAKRRRADLRRPAGIGVNDRPDWHSCRAGRLHAGRGDSARQRPGAKFHASVGASRHRPPLAGLFRLHGNANAD